MRAALLGFLLLLPGLAAAQQAQQQQRPRQPAQAEDLGQQVDRNLRTCMGQSRDMALAARCMDAQRAAIGPRLDNAVQQMLAAQQDPKRRADLAAVQEAWATYRDRRCAFAGNNPDRGAEAQGDRSACLLQFDVTRTIEIEAALAPPPPPPPQQQQRPPQPR